MICGENPTLLVLICLKFNVCSADHAITDEKYLMVSFGRGADFRCSVQQGLLCGQSVQIVLLKRYTFGTTHGNMLSPCRNRLSIVLNLVFNLLCFLTTLSNGINNCANDKQHIYYNERGGHWAVEENPITFTRYQQCPAQIILKNWTQD